MEMTIEEVMALLGFFKEQDFFGDKYYARHDAEGVVIVPPDILITDIAKYIWADGYNQGERSVQNKMKSLLNIGEMK